MNRRDIVFFLVALGVVPLAVQAQPVFRIGVLIHGTERTIGLTIPHEVLLRADEVIH